MSERLTASLEDGTLEKLRTLAGGERKVGAYLSDVVAWLWEYREALQARPLSGMALVHSEWIMTPEEQQLALTQRDRIAAALEDLQRRMSELEAQAKDVAAEQERRLSEQERRLSEAEEQERRLSEAEERLRLSTHAAAGQQPE